VVWDVPDLGKAPAVLAAGPLASTLGTPIASTTNNALLAVIGSDPDIKLFDVFGLVSNVIADPGAFGLSHVTDACAQFPFYDPLKVSFLGRNSPDFGRGSHHQRCDRVASGAGTPNTGVARCRPFWARFYSLRG
jgi:hypothetical protein